MPNPMPILDKKLVLVAPFASDSSSHPALQYVHVSRKGDAVETVATDSYTAARITRTNMPKACDFPIVPNSPAAVDLDGSILIPAGVVATTGKDIPKKTSIDILKTAALIRAPGSDNAELVATDLENVNRRAFKIEAEPYPDVDSLFNSSLKGALKFRVNAEYLKKIASMFHDFNGKRGLDAVDIEITADVSEPIRFMAESGGHKAEALLMRLRP